MGLTGKPLARVKPVPSRASCPLKKKGAVMTNKRVARKMLLCCALLLMSFARAAKAEQAECCASAVSMCDGMCQNHDGQYSCEESWSSFHCLCNDTHLDYIEKTVCAG